MKQQKKKYYTSCIRCDRLEDVKILEENSKYGGYGFERICNNCAKEIDSLQDQQQQDAN